VRVGQAGPSLKVVSRLLRTRLAEDGG
jgi:hypothetical protein